MRLNTVKSKKDTRPRYSIIHFRLPVAHLFDYFPARTAPIPLHIPFWKYTFKQTDCSGWILLLHTGFYLFAAYALTESYEWKYMCSFQIPLTSQYASCGWQLIQIWGYWKVGHLYKAPPKPSRSSVSSHRRSVGWQGWDQGTSSLSQGP